MKKINNRKKNKWVVRICVGVGILLIVCSIFAYILIRDLKQEDILRNEITSLSKKEYTKDRYNTKIKTKDDYAVVEETIKSYLDEYATNLQSLAKIASDKKMKTLLSAENYKNDGPEFKETKKYINETRTSFNTKLAELANMITEEEIMKKIENKNLDSYYVDLYKELMMKETREDDFKKSQENLEKLDKSINNILNTEEKVVDLLIGEKENWTTEDNKIVFKSTDTLNKYNELIKDYQNND